MLNVQYQKNNSTSFGSNFVIAPKVGNQTPSVIKTQNKNMPKVYFTGTAQAPHSKTSKGKITIRNYHHVDDVLTRGAKLAEAQILELKKHGYNTIIDFCTNYTPNSKPQLPREAKLVKQAGMNFYWMPFSSRENPPAKYIKQFFDITDNARMKGERVFMHCRHGADRTGAFAAMYKIRNYNISSSYAIKEMFKYGHDANGNQNIIPFITDFKDNNGILGVNPKGPCKRLIAKVKHSGIKMLNNLKIKFLKLRVF